MSRTLTIAALAVATLLVSATAYAGPAREWARETRQLGNKVTIDVYRRAPYALTGDVPATTSAPSGKVTRETRQLGNKVTIDVYRR